MPALRDAVDSDVGAVVVRSGYERTVGALVALPRAAGLGQGDPDLDVSLTDSVIVVEWGEGKVEELTEDRLNVVIHRAVGDTTDEVRHVTVTGLGERWSATDLSVLSA